MSGKVLAGIDSLSHDAEIVFARLAIALRRAEFRCALKFFATAQSNID